MPNNSGGSDKADQNAACADSEKIESSQLFDRVRRTICQTWCCDGFTGRGWDWSVMTSPAFLTKRAAAHAAWIACRALCLHRAEFEDGREFDQLGLVLVGVVLAEQQLRSRRQLGAHTSRGAATIAAVSPGQCGTGERCVCHCDLRTLRVLPLSQTF